MSCEKGESLREYISRVESQASVCQVEEGLTKEEVLFLSILRGTSNDVRTKVLQLFVEKPPTVAAIKLYADNIRSSEVKLSGGVHQVARPKKLSRPNKSSEKCDRCKKDGHNASSCTVKICDFCHITGHTKPDCFKDPASQKYKPNYKPRTGSGSSGGGSTGVQQIGGCPSQ